jgi:hypothetical protein
MTSIAQRLNADRRTDALARQWGRICAFRSPTRIACGAAQQHAGVQHGGLKADMNRAGRRQRGVTSRCLRRPLRRIARGAERCDERARPW